MDVARQSLKEDILRIVDEHSGGIKGLELLVVLIERHNFEILALSNSEAILDMIEREVESMPELGLLRYAHILDESTDREKLFIYRKFRGC